MRRRAAFARQQTAQHQTETELRSAVVVMVQAAEDRSGDNLATFRGINIPGDRSIAIERQVRPNVVVVVNVFSQDVPQMPFVEDAHVVEAFASDRADDAFGIGVLLGTSIGSSNILDAHYRQLSLKRMPIDAVVIANQESWRRLLGECLADLLSGPQGSGVGGDVEVGESV